MRTRTLPDGRLDGGFAFPLGCVAVVTAATAAGLSGAAARPGYALFALVLVVLALSAYTGPAAALGVTAVAWAVQSGFFVGRAGQLVFDAESARAALVLAAGGLTGLALGAVFRFVRAAGQVTEIPEIPAPRRPVPDPARRAATAASMRGRPAG
ncbi:hypothetical protein [Amycolatopsis sp. H20-H5]|uniref:hypothetical protein n=1 Tax=Amycolatopsis sp. H20-H5 TaxID=3046309 RepID=UPI002DBB79DD|nr:hypothetical protein [Amycolatopsis sp. H20-H5]MEC3979181.1 hypothetical protein [Amycolatopsis sp. H20-H5]